jgi:hypothetical protein
MLDNIEYTIHRPILTSIINDLKETVFKNKDIYTDYINNYEDSDFDSSKNIYNNNVKNERLEILSEIISNDNLALTNNVLRNNNKPLFVDDDITFRVIPNTINTTFNITLKYYNNSKNNIVKLLNKLKLSTINNNYFAQHTVEYYYNLPVGLLSLIKNINTLKNGEDTAYYPYIDSITTEAIDYINSRTKDYSIPTVREKQPVIGNFETDFFSKNKLDKDEKGWYIELEYIVDIDIPTNLIVQYPILVNNKQINKLYIPDDKHTEIIYGASDVIDALYRVTGSYFTDRLRNDLAILNYPMCDEFKPTIKTKPNMLRLMSLMCKLDSKDLTTLMNLNDFDNIIINKDIITYLKTRIGTTLFNPYEDIFHFELYENNNLVDKQLYVDEEFNIKTDVELDITKTYRLIFNAMYDLNSIPYTDRLENDVLTEYMGILNTINIQGVYNTSPTMYSVMITYIYTVNK